jgi:hypothetical protein
MDIILVRGERASMVNKNTESSWLTSGFVERLKFYLSRTSCDPICSYDSYEFGNTKAAARHEL